MAELVMGLQRLSLRVDFMVWVTLGHSLTEVGGVNLSEGP